MHSILKVGSLCLILTACASSAPLPAPASSYPYRDPVRLAALKNEAQHLGCTPVYYGGGDNTITAGVYGTGYQCVMHHFIQRNAYDFITRENRGNPGRSGILTFFESSKKEKTGNISLDLRDHIISGRPFKNMIGIRNSYSNISHIKIFNGQIETPGELSVSILMAPHKGSDYFNRATISEDKQIMLRGRLLYTPSREEKQEDIQAKRPVRDTIYEETAWDYRPVTHYTVDNLQITSGGRGVVFSGAENALRNSTVEVESQVAMVSYGPKVLIENNTFIVHMGKDYYTAPATSAIVKLRDADEAVIRNNRFIVKGWNGKSPAAINLINSKNVTIEGNTVEGAEILVRTDADSSVRETGNGLR